MKVINILPVLIILFIGVFAGNSIQIEEIKTSPPIPTFNYKSVSDNQLIIDLTSDKLQVKSTAMDQPKVDVTINRPIEYVEVLKYIQKRDTITFIDVRTNVFPLVVPKLSTNKPVMPNSVKRI